MSLIKGARELATNTYKMGCTVEHVFLAALPPYGYQNLDAPARQALNLFSGDTLDRWKLQVEAKLQDFVNPPSIGQDSADLVEALLQAGNDAERNKRDRDDDRSLLLAVVMRTKRLQDYIEKVGGGDFQRLVDRLNEGRTAPAGSGSLDVAKQKAEEEAKKKAEEEARRARASLPDLLREIQPSGDLRYADLPAVDVTTFFDFLADAATQAQVIVASGRDGTLIDKIPTSVADRLAKKGTFQGDQISLAIYTGKLYSLDLRATLTQAKQADAPRPASVLRAARDYVLEFKEKSILMLDHVEAIKSDAKEPEIEELRTVIASPGRQLVFGIFHAPNHGDHTVEANLGHEDVVRPLPMTVFDRELTRLLLAQFYLPLWRKELPHGYDFAENAFDLLMELEDGAWVHRRRTVLPGLVTDVVADAMVTAARGQDQVRAIAQGALKAFKELAKEDPPSPQDRARFEKILNQAKIEVSKLAPKRKWLFAGFGKPSQPQDPNKAIRITAAHVLAEFICHNVSEFHYPGKRPQGVTQD
jgi:hypothetical protein